jgi:DNA-3-methyladenine glycosylase
MARSSGRARRRVLPRAFYDRDTLTVTADLIGKVLVHRTADGLAAGAIVEDRGLHRRVGSRVPCGARADARNAPLYGPPASPTSI